MAPQERGEVRDPAWGAGRAELRLGLDFSDFCNWLLHFPQRYTSRRPGEGTLVFLIKPARATPSLGRRGLRHRETRPAARWQVRRGRAAHFSVIPQEF